MGKRGNKGKLTKELIKKICKYLEIGHTKKDACELCGISESVFYDWIKYAKEKKATIYSEFLESANRAETKCIDKHLANVNRKAIKDAGHSKWLLAKLKPDRFGDKQQVDLNANVSITFDKDFKGL
jgi:transposase-like protein